MCFYLIPHQVNFCYLCSSFYKACQNFSEHMAGHSMEIKYYFNSIKSLPSETWPKYGKYYCDTYTYSSKEKKMNLTVGQAHAQVTLIN